MIRKILYLSLLVGALSACAPTGSQTKTEPSVAPGANERFATPEGRTAAVKVLEGEGRDE